MTLVLRNQGRLARAFVIPMLLAVAWVWASRDDKPSFYFVGPRQFWDAFNEILATRELPAAMMASVTKAVSALAVGGLIGTLLGVLLAAKAPFEKVFGPSLHGFRQVPLLGLSPLIGLWFGNGASAQSALVLLASLFPTMLNALAGVRSIDVRLLEVAKVCGAGLGVGTMMQTAQAAGRMDVVLVCVVAVSLVGMLVNYGITGLGKRLTPWRDVGEVAA